MPDNIEITSIIIWHTSSHPDFALRIPSTREKEGFYIRRALSDKARLSKSNSPVNQMFTRPLSLVVQKVVQKYFLVSKEEDQAGIKGKS
jgi:hypothetical protein